MAKLKCKLIKTHLELLNLFTKVGDWKCNQNLERKIIPIYEAVIRIGLSDELTVNFP